jgi:hypothetical protein
MSANDVIVLQAAFERWMPRMAGITGIDPWLYYCVEQLLKPYALSDDDIQAGIVDGSDDGGADAIYFLVNNGAVVQEDTDLLPKTIQSVRLIFIQVKKSGGFKANEIAKIAPTLNDFLDLSKAPQTFAKKYNTEVLQAMKIFKEKYLQISGTAPEITVDYYYVTQDDAPAPDAKATAAMDEAKARVLAHFNKAKFNGHYIGAQELWAQAQKRPAQDRVLTWSAPPMPAQKGMVGLVKLSDYYNFLQDEGGVLAERIFESNVRGYQQSSPVNQDIHDTLVKPPKANFWLLNNGVTIISSKVSSAGHLRVSLHDPQIVNGLQTSRSIFAYFTDDNGQDSGRTLLVRVIETDNQEVRDTVIRATNSQNKMQDASLRMTDSIHRKIEELFQQYDLYYDRRKGFYKDQGVPVNKIISSTALAQALAAILLQRPDDARARPGKYFREDGSYKAIFGSDTVPLPVYLICVRIVQRVEEYLSKSGVPRKDITNIRFYIAALIACNMTDKIDPVPAEVVAKIAVDALSDKIIRDALGVVWNFYEQYSIDEDRDDVARGTELLEAIRAWKANELGVELPKKGGAT